MKRRMNHGLRGRAKGFTLIEVLVAILVLAFGLLGFALLQTMSVRFVQSANYRTQATNLAAALLDQMRTNRFEAASYAGASFDAGTVDGATCDPDPGTSTLSIDENISSWQCTVVRTLGETASATVEFDGSVVNVAISWNDDRSSPDPDRVDTPTSFALRTQL